MSYTPTQWSAGDTVTSVKLNKMEQGIANAGGANILVAHLDNATGSLDKTWQEIHDADLSFITIESINDSQPIVTQQEISQFPIIKVIETQGKISSYDVYYFDYANSLSIVTLSASNPNDYPEIMND